MTERQSEAGRLPTRAELRALRHLRRELEEMRMHLCDVENGNAGNMWYAGAEYRARVEAHIEKINATLNSLMRFIDEIEDSRTRRVFLMHYVYGWSWQKIAFQIDASSESTPRLLHTRYLQRLSDGENTENIIEET